MHKFRHNLLPTFLIFYLISISCIGIAHAQDNNAGDTVSIFVNGGAGKLYLYQVDQLESRLIWSKPVPFVGMTSATLVDMNNTGNPQVFAIQINDYAVLLDYKTGNLVWGTDIPSNDGIPKSIITGDLMNNGKNEIVVVSVTGSSKPDKGIMIFNPEGNITYIPTNEHAVGYLGADSALIQDLDNNGKNSLIIGDGNVIWNYTSLYGGYALEKWSWNSSSHHFNRINEVFQSEWGGNSRMIPYKSNLNNYIITAGWYNNPLRMFNSSFGLHGIRRFNNGARIELADTDIHLMDNAGQTSLIYVENNYWTNFTSHIYRLDLPSFALSELITTGNRVSSYSNVIDNTLFMYSRTYDSVSNNSYYRLESIEFSNPGYQYDVIDNSGALYSFPITTGDYPRIPVVNYGHPSVIAMDQESNVWLLNRFEKTNAFKTEALNPKIVGYVNHATPLSGQHLQNLSKNSNSLSNYYALIGIISSLLIVGSIMAYARIIPEKNFDKHFEKDWKVNFYLKLNKIIRRLVKEKIVTNEQLMLSSAKSIKPTDDGDDIVEFTEMQYPVLPEKFNLPSLRKYASGLPHFNIWLESLPKKAKNLKIGDIAILMEILEIYPQDSLTNDIVSKFNFSTKTTIYNRINFLKEMQLIEDIGVDIYDEDIRSKKINLTSSGLELLASLYLSLEMSLNAEKGI